MSADAALGAETFVLRAGLLRRAFKLTLAALTFSLSALLTASAQDVPAPAPASAVSVKNAASVPVKSASPFAHCPQGRQQRAGILQLGPLPDLQDGMRQTLLALSRRGLILTDGAGLPEHFKFDEEKDYAELSRRSAGDCLTFLPDGLYTARWQARDFSMLSTALYARMQRGDFDLVLGMGAGAGLFFSQRELPVPVLIMQARSPETAGISVPGEFSGRHNLHVQKEPRRYVYELNMFYDIFRFRRLGVVLDKNYVFQLEQGRTAIETIAKARGFEPVYCTAEVFSADAEHARRELTRCFAELAGKADAVYLTENLGVDPQHYLRQLRPLIEARLPTMAQSGGREVAMGALLSDATASNEALGEFEANVIAKVMSGTDPAYIEQYFYAPQIMSLNMRTARAIGWRPPFAVLAAADVIYHNFDSLHQRSTSSGDGTLSAPQAAPAGKPLP